MFDDIPLTALAMTQGGYDWGMLAYAVGFGGSMIWFGSSAGVALSNQFPEAKSVGLWLRHGWHVAVAYVVGFFALLAILGWQPTSGIRDCPRRRLWRKPGKRLTQAPDGVYAGASRTPPAAGRIEEYSCGMRCAMTSAAWLDFTLCRV